MKKYLKGFALLVAMIMVFSVFAVGCSQKAENAPASPELKQEAPKEEPKKEEVKKGTDWPTKTIQFIVPFKPGGDTDFNARVYAKYLEKELGQPIVVVNVDGNSGALGSRKVKDSKPDGYTVLFYHSAMQVNELTGMVDYGFKDLDLACIAGKNAGDIFTVRADSPYKTLKDLVEASQKEPGKIKMAAGLGATTHLTSIMLNDAGAKLNIVDAGSSTDRTSMLLGGHVDVVPNPYGVVKPYLESGDFRALGVNHSKRNPQFQDIPTALEQGYDSVLESVYFFEFPKGTDPQIIEKLSKAVGKIAANNAEYAEEITKFNQAPFYLDKKEATDFLNAQRDTFFKYKDQIGAK
ncbi:MAG: tripartite tricarboxylate transporter substrate binding protein [Clostridia bacterium]